MSQPDQIYAGLRSRVFATRPEDVGISPSQVLPHVWGALMEFQRCGTTVTLVALADGSTSLYFSNGGGIVGAGSHPAVAKAARDFVAAAEALYPHMQSAADFPLPSAGRVRFYALTFTGVRTAERSEEALVSRPDDLWPLFTAANEVLAQILPEEAPSGEGATGKPQPGLEPSRHLCGYVRCDQPAATVVRATSSASGEGSGARDAGDLDPSWGVNQNGVGARWRTGCSRVPGRPKGGD